MAARERQTRGRKELGEAHPSEVQRPPCDRVDLPANRDVLHLHTEYRQDARPLESAEVAVSEGRPSSLSAWHVLSSAGVGEIREGVVGDVLNLDAELAYLYQGSIVAEDAESPTISHKMHG